MLMGVDELTEDNDLPVSESMTIGELADIYGKSAVKRGLSYIMNLKSADEAYKQSANGQSFEAGVKEAYDVDESDADMDEAVSKWEDSMRKGGLGISDE